MDLRLQPLEPTNWNRAEGEELDEQEEDQRIDELKQPTFKFEESVTLNNNKYECDILCIGLCGAGAAFIRAAILNRCKPKKIGILEQPQEQNTRFDVQEELHYHVSKKTTSKEGQCTFYALQGNSRIVVGECTQKITPLQSHQWAQTLFNTFQVTRLVVLESILQSQYRGESIPYPPFIRSLQTTQDLEDFNRIPIINEKKKNIFVEPLEAPNIIEGLAAALLTKRQIQKSSAALLVSIEENHILESDTLRAYERCVLPILKLEIGHDIDYKSVLAKLKGRKVNQMFL